MSFLSDFLRLFVSYPGGGQNDREEPHGWENDGRDQTESESEESSSGESGESEQEDEGITGGAEVEGSGRAVGINKRGRENDDGKGSPPAKKPRLLCLRGCTRDFATASNRARHHFKAHRQTHDTLYVCKVAKCRRQFALRCKLREHYLAAHNKRFVCREPGCGRRFGEKRNRDSHEHVHSRDKPFQCAHCGKRSGWKNAPHKCSRQQPSL